MANKKSAKDIAFEKERNRLKKQIKEEKNNNSRLEAQISLLKEENCKKNEQIRQQKEWIERLLQYMDLSESEMKQILEADKVKAECLQTFSGLFNIYKHI